jgi:hypothetical protein
MPGALSSAAGYLVDTFSLIEETLPMLLKRIEEQWRMT